VESGKWKVESVAISIGEVWEFENMMIK